MDLEALQIASSNPVPSIVNLCLTALEKRGGLEYEGIFRKSGPVSQSNAIQAYFVKGEEPDLLNTEEFNDITSITSVLKRFFMDLKVSLIGGDHYDEFIKASKLF